MMNVCMEQCGVYVNVNAVLPRHFNIPLLHYSAVGVIYIISPVR